MPRGIPYTVSSSKGKREKRVPRSLYTKDCAAALAVSGFPQPLVKESHSISQWEIQLLEPPGPHANSTPPLRCATPTALSPPHAHPSRPGVAVYPPDPVVSWTQGIRMYLQNWHHPCPACGVRPRAVTHPHPGSTLVPTHKWRSFVTKASF